MDICDVEGLELDLPAQLKLAFTPYESYDGIHDIDADIVCKKAIFIDVDMTLLLRLTSET